jgi:NitT/TauT family transport system substrate-binding protein
MDMKNNKPIRRGPRIAAMMLTSVLILAGCGGSSEDSSVVASGDCESVEKLDYNLSFILTYSTAPIVLAKNKGWYEEECIDLNIIQGQGSSSTIQQMSTRTSVLGETDAMLLAAAQAKGAPLTAVGVIAQDSPFAIMVRPEALTDAQKSAEPFDLESR